MKVEERLLKYVGYHTTSDEASDKIPSSDREFALARELESELKELGLSKVVLTDHCYVYGLLPATAGMEHKKSGRIYCTYRILHLSFSRGKCQATAVASL